MTSLYSILQTNRTSSITFHILSHSFYFVTTCTSMPKSRKHAKGLTRETQSARTHKAKKSIEKPLEEQPYFHGILPREEIKGLLRNEGEFLIRESGKSLLEVEIVLSVYWHGKQKHIKIEPDDDGLFRLEKDKFETVPQLINHYMNEGIPVTTRVPAKLRTPITKLPWELNNDDIIIKEKLGAGNYAEVHRGYLKTQNNREVAIKQCRFDSEKAVDEKKKFLMEARLMRNYTHPNVIEMIGVCASREPLMIVMEIMKNGPLNSYLAKHNEISTHLKYSFCLDAATGMEYLAQKNCIHRDLAARNCLLDEKLTVKIADFGLARQSTLYMYSSPNNIPVKWTAPEALKDKQFTAKADVWSFGILIWEVFSRGEQPYPTLTNNEICEAQRIYPGIRPDLDQDVPNEIKEIYLKCTSYNKNERPNFTILHYRLLELFKSNR